MLIGIDLDEVLADFISAFAKYHNATYATSFKKDDFFSYKLWDVLKCEKDDAIQRLGDFFESPYFKQIQPIEGSIDAISQLKKDYKLAIITSRQERVREEAKRWINHYFPNLFSEIYFSNNHYTQTGGNKTKLDICKEINADLMIEDSLDYALECQKEIKVLLFNQPWNQSEELPDNLSRVYSWNEILEYIFLKRFKKE